jgi:tetratricopeptide (TPR) repeat protein
MFTSNKKSESKFSLNTFTYYALLICVFLVPILTYTASAVPPAITKIALSGVLVLLVTILFALMHIKEQQLSLPRSLLLCSAWLIPFAYFLSTLLSSDTTHSMYGKLLSMDSFVFMLTGAIILTVSAVLLQSQTRILGVYLAMLASAITLSALQLILFFGRDFVASTGVVMSSLSLLGSLNDLAVFYGLIVALTVLSLLILPLTLAVRSVLWVALVIALYFLMVVNLTVLWWILAVFALGCLVYSIYTSHFNKKSETQKFSVASLATLAVTLFFIFGPTAMTVQPSLSAKVGELDIRPNWSTTVSLGRTALDNRAIFGAGPESFENTWSKAMPAEIHSSEFWKYDFSYGAGLLPTIIISTGLIGAIGLIVFFSLLFWFGIKSLLLSPTKENEITTYVRAVAFFGSVYLWGIAWIQVPSPALIVYAFVLTGIFIASLSINNLAKQTIQITYKENPRIGFLLTLLLTVVVLGSIGGIYGYASRFYAEASFQKAIQTINSTGELDEGQQILERAVYVYPLDGYYRTLSNIHLIRLQQLIEEGRDPTEIREEVQTILSRAIQNATRATELAPNGYRNWQNLGQLYQNMVALGIEGSSDSAIIAFDSALALRPNAPDMLLSKAVIERTRGDIDKALEHTQQALTYRNSYVDAIFFLAQLQIEKDDLESAINTVEAVTMYEPQNPIAYFQLGLLHYGNNSFSDAERAFLQAIQLNDLYANARYFLGLTYWRLERTNDAIAQFEKVLETNPDNTEVRTIISNLKSGFAPTGTVASSTADIQNRDGLPINEEAQQAGDTTPDTPTTLAP